MKIMFKVVSATMMLFSVISPVYSQTENEPAAGAGEASDPTAAINFQDIRFRYLDLGDDKHRRWYNTEGGYMVSPKFKIIN